MLPFRLIIRPCNFSQQQQKNANILSTFVETAFDFNRQNNMRCASNWKSLAEWQRVISFNWLLYAFFRHFMAEMRR